MVNGIKRINRVNWW